jgi:RNA polymerase sigma factor (sigma-70 family)
MVDSRGDTYSTLSKRAREGDPDAENELLLRAFADSRRAVGRIVGDPDAADDVLQDAMVLLLRRLRGGGLSDPEATTQFVYGVARRLQANVRRKELRRRNSQLRADTHAALVDPAPSALTALLMRERRQLIRAALARMQPARDRLILYRLYVLDHDRARIRRDLNLSMSAFDRVLSRARARLCRLFNDR